LIHFSVREGRGVGGAYFEKQIKIWGEGGAYFWGFFLINKNPYETQKAEVMNLSGV
jgi:hypothetical protein